MPLPNTRMNNHEQWQKLHDEAETKDARAIVGAAMLLAVEIQGLYDAIVSLDPKKPTRFGE